MTSTHCGEPGANETVLVALAEPTSVGCAYVDRCIAPLVEALNAAGIRTLASCCGHGVTTAAIALADGRQLVILDDIGTEEGREQWRTVSGYLSQPWHAIIDDKHEPPDVEAETTKSRTSLAERPVKIQDTGSPGSRLASEEQIRQNITAFADAIGETVEEFVRRIFGMDS